MSSQSSLPSRAKAVVIGGGIVGNSIVYHLARLGWHEIVQIDKGPFPIPNPPRTFLSEIQDFQEI